MSDNKNEKGMTKADVILTRVEQLTRQVSSLEARVARGFAGANNSGATAANDAVIRKLTEENAMLKKEISYVSAQIEGLFATLSKMINKLPEKIGANPVQGKLDMDVDDLASRVAAKIIIPETGYAASEPAGKVVAADGIDYDALGYSVAKRIYVPQAIAEEVDYDKLAEKVGANMPPVNINYEELGVAVAKRMYIPQAIAEDVDCEQIANKVLEKLPAFTAAAAETAYTSAEPVYAPAENVSVQAEIDYDLLASKVAEAVAVQEPVSPDYIAARVAEQIIIPQTAVQAEAVDLDVEELSRKVADKIAIPAYEPAENVNEERLAEAIAEKLKESEEEGETTPVSYEANLDEQSLAENIASRLNFSLSDELIAAAVVKNLSDAIDSDEIADCVAKRVGSISPEQFEITVDDDGCDSLAKAVESKLNYDALAAAVAEKLNPAFMSADVTGDIDADELARVLSEKLSVNADINEDLLADKAAAILSNYLPEVDSADIADKVVAGIIPALPATPVIDSEGIANSVSEKLVENQENSDYEIVIDDDGLTRISASVSEEISKDEDERHAKLNGELDNMKEEYGKRFDKIDGDIEEIKSMLLSGIVVAAGVSETAAAEVVEEEPQAEEQLVTVSDLLVEEEPAEEEPAAEESDEVIEEIVEDIDENLSDEEIMPDGMDGLSGGVDFANMMKYNRSFIARIIQGTDDQKNYYGQVKTALLSYKKVNSNVAWGAERFNKGRETIARFKIRGKTLCLYLALDPDEYATSVYHHADVSDNKSMHGTPMMVKIKSPLGVKKAIRLIDDMLAKRNGEKRYVAERDYAAMYPYETIEELIEDGLVKDVNK